MMLSETDKKFAEAVHIFQNLPQELRPTQEEELEFYGLYKRAVVGQCNIPKPDFFNILALAKWEAWKKLDSLSMLKAREIYVEQLIKLLERFPDRPDVVELLDTFTKLHLNDTDDVGSAKSQEKINNIPSNNSDSINNDFQENQHVDFTSRDANSASNSINMNASMNSSINSNILSPGPGLPNNNSSQSATEELLLNNNRTTTRNRSKTDGSIYNSIPADMNPLNQDEPSLRSDNTFSMNNNNSTMNSKITSPLNPSVSPLPNNMSNMNSINLGMGMGINMNNPNAKIAASTSMSIVMLTRLRDLEIEVASLNSRLNMLTNMISNQNKNSLQNWLKFILRTFGANLIIVAFFLLILGPSGFEKLIGRLPPWVLKLQTRYIMNGKSNTTKAICDN